jgi:hypothetical protein
MGDIRQCGKLRVGVLALRPGINPAPSASAFPSSWHVPHAAILSLAPHKTRLQDSRHRLPRPARHLYLASAALPRCLPRPATLAARGLPKRTQHTATTQSAARGCGSTLKPSRDVTRRGLIGGLAAAVGRGVKISALQPRQQGEGFAP